MTAMPTRSCACGCGQAVRTDSRTGRPRRYVLGHNPTPGRTPLPPAPDPNAPEDAPRCAACPYPLVFGSHAGPPPPGWRWHQGRGLCTHCYQRAARAGRLGHYPLGPPEDRMTTERLTCYRERAAARLAANRDQINARRRAHRAARRSA